MVRTVRFSSLSAVVLAILSACGNPFTEEAAVRLTDHEPPVISITSPEDGSPFGSLVEVRGRVDDDTGRDSPGRVSRLWFAVSPEIVAGADVEIAADGSFDLRFPSVAFTSDIVVRLYAEDWNGNRCETSLTLTFRPSQIPSFRAVPGPRSMTFSWDAPLYSDGYSLHGWRIGESRTATESPFVWHDLRNGQSYTFQLQSHTREDYGADNWSSIVTATPLAPTTLVPRIRAGFDRLGITWNQIDATESYTLLRATSADGPYMVRSLTTEASFVDTDVLPGVPYYYRVHPSDQDAVISERTPAITAPADGTAPTLLSIDQNGLSSYDVALAGSYAYVVTNGDGLCIYDVSEPSAPVLVQRGLLGIEGASWATAAIEYNRLYTTFTYYDGTSRNDLWVLDISEPTSPVLIHAEPFALGGLTRSVVVRDGIVYAATSNQGLKILDATVPAELSLIATPEYGDGTVQTRSLALHGNHLYFGDTGGNPDTRGLWAIDVHDPGAPGEPTRMSGDDLPDGAFARWIGTNDDRLFVIDSLGGLNVFTLANPAVPEFVDRVAVEHEVSGTKAPVCLEFVGTTAYVSVFNAGVKVVNVAAGVKPYVMTTVGSVNAAYHLKRSADVVYASDLYTGLVALSVHSQPTFEDTGGTVTTAEPPTDVAAVGGTLYAIMTDGGSGGAFHVYDATASTPNLLGSTELPRAGHVIELHGEHALVLSEEGLTLVNVSAPRYPAVVGTVSTPTRPTSVTIRGDYAYVAMQNGGLAVYDICVPSEPVEVSSGAVYGSTIAVAIVGSVGYLASGDIGITIVDLTDPVAPTQIGTISPGFRITNVLADGSHLYAYGTQIGGGPATIICYDVSVRAAPREVSRRQLYDDEDWRYGLGPIKLFGRYMVAAYRNPHLGFRADGVIVIDAKAPEGVSVFSSRELPLRDGFYRTAFVGERVYVTAEDGIRIFSFDMEEM